MRKFPVLDDEVNWRFFCLLEVIRHWHEWGSHEREKRPGIEPWLLKAQEQLATEAKQYFHEVIMQNTMQEEVQGDIKYARSVIMIQLDAPGKNESVPRIFILVFETQEELTEFIAKEALKGTKFGAYRMTEEIRGDDF